MENDSAKTDISDLTVMIIEDEDLLLKAIVKKFESKGVETVSCVSGEQALDYLHNFEKTGAMPDAVWLDYYLKSMDGLELLSEMKKIVDIKKMPIVVVSNSASEEKVTSMLALGADKYFLKAKYKLDQLVDELVNLVKERSLD